MEKVITDNINSDTPLNLQDLFDGNRKQYKMLKWCMANRGWIMNEFPIKYRDEMETLCDNFGFTNYKWALRVHTNTTLELFKSETRGIIEAIESISGIMDKISVTIIKKTQKIWSDGNGMTDLCLMVMLET